MIYTYTNSHKSFLSGGDAPRTPFQHDQTSNARTHAKRAHARAIYFRFAAIKVNI